MPRTTDFSQRFLTESSPCHPGPAAPASGAGTLHRRTVLATLAATAAGLAAPGAAWAQAASDRPLRLVLPVSAGSGVDGLARAFGPGLGKALGRGVVIENFPGAGGITGTSVIVKAPKDGSVLGMVSNNHVVNPSVYKNIPYDAVQDITPITVIGATPFVLVAHPSVAAKNVRELIALAKAQPGTLNYGSSGNGTILHLAAEMFVHEAQVDIKHIPYRGMGPLTADVLGGQIQMAFIAVAVAAPHVKAGTLKAIGLSSTTRSPLLPDLATIAEQGLPQYALDGWVAMVGPAGLPKAEAERVHQAVVSALAVPEIRDALLAQGYQLQATAPEPTAAFFRTEVARMARLVKQSGLKID
ncbi:tripartite tricarboxylate transporter substrate binding protein [Acidovorax sp. BL-A-41-H1]|uniref:tripartite tricarboxylate transporter substrate binding protein n=1 Tax=Acidovorax sp. BL-A-41-H1 TaxID=3421102 RepID=UPI003F7A5772